MTQEERIKYIRSVKEQVYGAMYYDQATDLGSMIEYDSAVADLYSITPLREVEPSTYDAVVTYIFLPNENGSVMVPSDGGGVRVFCRNTGADKSK